MPIAGFTIALLISTLSILSIGFIIASIVPTARFAQPIGAVILYPMIGLSGLFVPIDSLPPVLRTARPRAAAHPLGVAAPGDLDGRAVVGAPGRRGRAAAVFVAVWWCRRGCFGGSDDRLLLDIEGDPLGSITKRMVASKSPPVPHDGEAERFICLIIDLGGHLPLHDLHRQLLAFQFHRLKSVPWAGRIGAVLDHALLDIGWRFVQRTLHFRASSPATAR